MVRIGMFLGDRYEILEKVGSGGMADVFKGKDHKLNRFVAIKVLKDEFVEDKNFVRKFKEEAQAAAGLAHPNIVNVYDVGDEQNINYIVMELVEGITLKTYIEKKGKLTVKEATSIAIQVSAGLEIAHNNQIVHRDIKPQNIIISREGKVKVTDFGIAKSVSSNTNTADSMGSVHYTSPEQARGGYSDAKSDIYSLGIVMYEMVTGRVPFDGDTTVVVAVKHLQEDIVSPRVYSSEIPVSLEHIILKCTEKSPDRRYGSISELIADLKQSLVTPDVNFVKAVVPGGAKTVAITRDEVSKIRRETGRIQLDEDDAESKYAFLDDEDYDDEDYGEYDDEEYDDEDYGDEDDEEEEEDEGEGGILDPKLEKIMTIGGIAAAVIIVIIVIFIVAKVFGFGKGGKKPADDNEPQIEDVIEENPEVPNLLGKSFSEAKEELNELGLGISVSETQPSDEYEPGQIISQDVAAGTEVEAHTTINVVICGDGKEAEVPDVKGYSLANAEKTLKDAGFTTDVEEVFDDNVEKGNVISTSPKAGSKVDRSTVIVIKVSKGSEEEAEAEVPKLEGRTEEEAKKLLKDAGLASGSVTEEASDDVEKGRIISQSVKAGTKVPKDTAISYVVSAGADVYIGNAMKHGSSESAVTKYLTDRGLKVSRSEEYSDSVTKGDVISYSPGNGSTVKIGSTVNIVVSKGPKPVESVSIPEVRGLSEADAKNKLSQAGFGVDVETAYSSASEKGKVIAQDTGSAKPGSLVTITVSLGQNPDSCTHTPDANGTCTICGKTGLNPPTPPTEPTEPTEPTTPGTGGEGGGTPTPQTGE